MKRPVLIASSAVMAHVPGLVRLGSKPARELARDPQLEQRLVESSRSFDAAVGYLPNQAFIGAVHPREMGARPHFSRSLAGAGRFTQTGEIMPEIEFLGLMAMADQFKLLRLNRNIGCEAGEALARHPLRNRFDLQRLEAAVADHSAESEHSIALHLGSGQCAGSISDGHDGDANLDAAVIAENLACKTSGALALLHLLCDHGIDPGSVDYVLGCAEDAIGDRYQRGGGNMGKAIAEMAGCSEASGADIKNFCAAPIPAMVIAASLVSTGIFRRVAVVGGASLPKVGMKFQGHLKHGMPVLEDMLGGIAVLIGEDDGHSPLIRLDSVGTHRVRSGASAEAIMDALVTAPLDRIGLRMTDVDEYATELHNPELTEPQGSGNVPERNYRMLAAMAVRRRLLVREEISAFMKQRGMPGFAPTQGHIASAFCYAGHAYRALTDGGGTRRVMMLAKGSLFLGMMTQQSDGMSFLLERNHG